MLQNASPFDRYSGTFGLTHELHEHSRIAGMFDSTLRGIGQIFLMNNPLTGLAIAVAVSVHSVWMGVMLLLGAMVATLLAHLLGYADAVIRLGFYSFNGALFGVLGAVFLAGEWVWTNLILTLLVAALSVPVMKVTIEVLAVTFQVPALSLTFGVVGSFFLLLMPATAYSNADTTLLQPVERYAVPPDPVLRATLDGGEVGLLPGLFNATFRGVSQVVLVDSVLIGVLIVLAIALATRFGAVMAVLGSLAGSGAGMLIGADGFEVYHGLWGYNGAVVAAGLFGIVLEPNWRSFVASIFAAASSGLLYGALSELLAPYGIIPLSLPLVIVIIGSAFAFSESRITVISIPEYSNAEHRIRIHRKEAELS